MNLAYPEYYHVPALKFYISVIKKIIVKPSEVYLLVGDTISYCLYHRQGQKPNELSWASQQYYLSVDDAKVAKIIQDDKIVGLKSGQTTVSVHDRYFARSDLCKSEEGIQQNVVSTALLVVTKPKKLKMFLAPYDNWITVRGETHQIVAALFNRYI